jgi:hypothetical protein
MTYCYRRSIYNYNLRTAGHDVEVIIETDADVCEIGASCFADVECSPHDTTPQGKLRARISTRIRVKKIYGVEREREREREG